MKYIFWNTNKNRSINIYIEKIIEVYSPDFIGLAEYDADGRSLENALRKKELDYTYIPRIGSRLDLFYKGNAAAVKHFPENKHYTIKVIPYEKQLQIVSVVHFPSKLYSDDSNNAEVMQEMLGRIGKIKETKAIEGVVIFGDFNMNPFENPMIEATALQAIQSRKMVYNKKKRIYNGNKREFYYNPMWNFLGDQKEPIGSYYYKSPANKAFYWNTFDQFVVNDKYVNQVDLNRIKFINEVDNILLRDKNGKPNVSDHFPLYFEIGESK